MTIFLKNKHTLKINEFYLKCSIGKNGLTQNKVEGDKKTPIGTFKIEHLYYRKERIILPKTNLKCIQINPEMGWCDDVNNKKYNKLIKTDEITSHEKLYRKDYKYDLLIPIKYNFYDRIPNKGSCIFIHLTKNYKATAGCVALQKKDFLVMLNLINKNTRIKIY